MKKYTVTAIKKVEDNKAALKYKRGTKEIKTSRTIYTEDGIQIILFKGIKLEVVFNPQGIATNVTAKGIYDDSLKGAEAEARLNSIGFELATTIVEEIKQQVIVPKVTVVKNDGQIKHGEFDTIKTCVENSIPVYLYGPAGSGKNHVLQQIAEELNLDFYFTNSVQQEYKITGFIDAGGKFHETEFYKAWTKGGLFFLDEMDASIPEVLILLNAALANGYFDFPGFGRIDAHEDFRVVSAGNTVGTGADEQYTGRMQLDQATLDRFIFIEFDYDKNIELAIAKGNKELVEFIRDLRKQAQEKGISATFSYRCIAMVVKLEDKLELKKVLLMAVLKGMDKDTLRTLNTNPQNKYSKALWSLKQAS